MKRILFFVLIIFVSHFFVLAQQKKPDDIVKAKTDTIKLKELSVKFNNQYNLGRKQALEYAKKNNIPLRRKSKEGATIELIKMENGFPVFYSTNNIISAKTISTDKVQLNGSSGLNLRGEGVRIGIWDGGSVYAPHQSFYESSPYLSRVNNKETTLQYDNHATHVAGTMIADNDVAAAKGMADKVQLDSYDWDNDLTEMANASRTGDLLRLSNHSYAKSIGWMKVDGNWHWLGKTDAMEDYDFSQYSQESLNFDEIANAAPYYTLVVAAGNDRLEGPDGYVSHYVYYNGIQEISNAYRMKDGESWDGYRTISHKAVSKNVITVGAVDDIPNSYQNSSEVKQINTSFSNWGPSSDGRIKPDIVANGDNVYSTIYEKQSSVGSYYDSYSGTSMATPAVTGSIALLTEHYFRTHNTHPKAATLKAVVIQSADEAGLYPGPDYQFGWGLMNTSKAAALISKDQANPLVIQELRLNNGEQKDISFYNNGYEQIKVTIVWSDPVSSTSAVLVNDLDIKLSDGSNIFYPWKLNHLIPENAATTGIDNSNNVEQILLSAPSAGNYTLTVNHKRTLANYQDFSLIIEGISPTNAEIVLNQYDSQGNLFGQAGYWMDDQWNYVNANQKVTLPFGNNYFMADKEYKSGSFEKFKFIKDNLNNTSYRIGDIFDINPNSTSINSYFRPTYNANLKIYLEGLSTLSETVPGDVLKFSDPWLNDVNEFPYGWRNRGNNSIYNDLYAPGSITQNSSYKGVFIESSAFDFSSSQPTYAIDIPDQTLNLSQTNRSHKFYFENWGGASVKYQNNLSPNTKMVFTGVNPTVVANLKGHLLSNQEPGYTNNGQRKIVRDGNKRYHAIYVSQNRLWYTYSINSNDINGEWSKDIPLTPDYFIVKNPSISIFGDKIDIVYELATYDIYNSIQWLTITYGAGGVIDITSPLDIAFIDEVYFGSSKPLVNRVSGEVLFIFKREPGTPIKYKRYYYNNQYNNWQWQPGNSGNIDPFISGELNIPGADPNSVNPTIASDLGGIVQIAWEENNAIYYTRSDLKANVRQFNSSRNISSLNGFIHNANPSIIEFNGYPRVVWKAGRYFGSVYDTKICFTDPTDPYTTRYWTFGTQANEPSFNRNSTGYAFAWSKNDGINTNYFVDNSLSTIRTLNTTGKNLQLTSGDNKSEMFVLSSKQASPLYDLQISNSLGSFGKLDSKGHSEGRQIVIGKDSLQFYFLIGDVKLDGETLPFTNISDTTKPQSNEELCQFLTTIPFEVNNHSSFNFSIEYGFTDSSAAIELLKNEKLKIKVQLYDENKSSLLGEFTEMIFNKSDFEIFSNKSFSINSKGIGKKKVILKVIFEDLSGTELSVSQFYSDELLIAKNSVIETSYQGSLAIYSYDMFQNYPNPFNPSTMIEYQIPENGHVTLKVYDILGNEIAVLVNEFRQSGRYQVNFDASKLASGMYIYQITTNKFNSSKKMVLIK